MDENEETENFETHPSFIVEHLPNQKDIQYKLGPYHILQNIGKGGMGEVLLAYDTTCGRRIALKKIREDLLKHKQIHTRFLKEARITSQLTHPAIIPIYTIQDENNVVYYTMPFVQGQTLKQILKLTRDQEKRGEPLHHIGGSIPALIRIFISVCQAVAYAHSKGVLHRDLKPENIIVGEYGEVLILDWGLAKLIREKESDAEIAEIETKGMTKLGRVVGTVTYMAPERGMGNPATIQTEIYALGVILYQILTLHSPFIRSTLEEFKKSMDHEVLMNPSEIAPYRDVPRILSRIAKYCLAKNPEDRYASVNDLIRELENYIEGRSEWFEIAELNIKKKSDWEFQEHVLLREHIAITREPEISEWVSLMISKGSFTGNTKIEGRIKIHQQGHGIGFLMSIPEAAERIHLNAGYCLWLGSDINKSTKLLRSTVEVVHAPEIFLEREKWYNIRIEKVNHNLFFYLNDVLQFSYFSHLPLVGTHLGILSKDADFSLEDLTVYVSSQNVTVNCLAVPDAFLAHKDYATALNEYRRIGYSFPGRAEGREAMFRAGITLLEQAGACTDPEEKKALFEATLQEFEKLRATSGAPLEYLGKAYVYRALYDYDEEIKCFELGFRRYPYHPLLPILQEQILYRMHESSHFHRESAYSFILTALRHLPKTTINTNASKLFSSLEKHWEPLPFILKDPKLETSDALKNHHMAIQLAFWLAKPFILLEIIEELQKMEDIPTITISNAQFCLLVLGHPSNYENNEPRMQLYQMEKALDQFDTKFVFNLANQMPYSLSVECNLIWAYLLEKQWDKAGEMLHKHPFENLTEETSLLHTLYGCWLYATEGKDIAEIHFAGVLDVTYPRSQVLLSHYLNGKISENQPWQRRAFLYEKRQLYRQLSLYYHCAGDTQKSQEFAQKAQEMIV